MIFINVPMVMVGEYVSDGVCRLIPAFSSSTLEILKNLPFLWDEKVRYIGEPVRGQGPEPGLHRGPHHKVCQWHGGVKPASCLYSRSWSEIHLQTFYEFIYTHKFIIAWLLLYWLMIDITNKRKCMTVPGCEASTCLSTSCLDANRTEQTGQIKSHISFGRCFHIMWDIRLHFLSVV